MHAVEFIAEVTNGMIAIPEEYRAQICGKVRVVVLPEEEEPSFDAAAELLADPLKIPDFTPLTRDEAHER